MDCHRVYYELNDLVYLPLIPLHPGNDLWDSLVEYCRNHNMMKAQRFSQAILNSAYINQKLLNLYEYNKHDESNVIKISNSINIF